ncbi:phosphoribosylanthranilate isomerase [Streptomyces sp. NPDC002851]
MLVKFCGATTEVEADAVAEVGADLLGLWHHVPGGRAELGLERLTELSARARAAGLTPVLVTFATDPEALLATLAAARVPWVQLHGYQPPGVVRALRRGGPEGLRIAKVLHVQGDSCAEGGLTRAYERAGADCFLLDAMTPDGRLGSTAHALNDEVTATLADTLPLPFLLAGGLTAHNHTAFPRTTAHPRFLGIDVDTAARGPDGRLNGARAARVAEAWRAADSAAS